ncbi:MAG TPA: alpha/beta fold hydrolase [Burkholderiaceae bacterium]|nr:alpha/beta fold hydrolase [Burkholderiaceae bacterium]
MTDVLFIQGAGEGAHEVDAKLVASLAAHLGAEYSVRYPAMPAEGEPMYAAWASTLSRELASTEAGFVLVGHSLGASLVLRYLALNDVEPRPAAVFLVSAPFIGPRGWSGADFELPLRAAAKLGTTMMFFYHGDADEVVPAAHVGLYEQAFAHATVRLLAARNHQLHDDLSAIAADIRLLH